MSEQDYSVPVSAHGAVIVRASSPEEAFEIARDKADPGEANLSMDVDRAFLERVKVVEDPRRNPINLRSPSSPADRIPEFPTVDSLRRARKRLGLTQREVADRMGVDSRTVSHYEQRTREISLSRARDYEQVLREAARQEEA